MRSHLDADYDGPIADLERLVRMELRAKEVSQAVEGLYDDQDALVHILGDSDDEAWATIRRIEVETDDLLKILDVARTECENRLEGCLDVPEEGEE